MEIVFKPSEEEAGSTVTGELIEKKEVKTKYGPNTLFKVKTHLDVKGMLGPKEVIVLLWGTKHLIEKMEPFKIGDTILINYQGSQEFTKGDLTWTAHQWEVAAAE